MSGAPPVRSLYLDCGSEEPASSENIPIQFNLHSCFYNDFFLLRTQITINDNPAEIKINPVSGISRIQHSESGVDYPLSDLVPGVAVALSDKHGVYHIDTFYHEQDALFSVVFPSRTSLRKFLDNKDEVESDLAEVLSTQLIDSTNKTQANHDDQQRVTVSGDHSSGQESHVQLQVRINAELFLASPVRVHSSEQQNRHQPEVHKVTLATFEHFIDKWQQSHLFDFGSYMFSEEALLDDRQFLTVDNAELKDLQRELKGVAINWFQFGLELNIPREKMLVIRKDNILFGVEQCLLEVLICWEDLEKPTWTKVVTGLITIGRPALAEYIAKKYGVKLPVSTTTVTQDTTEPSMEHSEWQLLRKERDLDTAIKSRNTLLENIDSKLVVELMELQGQNSSLEEEIEYLKTKLHHKSEESEYLEKSQKKMKSSWRETVERMIKESNEQVKELQQQLVVKKNLLAQINGQLHQKDEELEKKNTEIEENSNLVKRLQEEVEKLKRLLSEKQEDMNLKCIESTLASQYSTNEQKFEEMKLKLEHAKHEVDAKTKEIEHYKQDLASKDEDLRRLLDNFKETKAKRDNVKEETGLSENELKHFKLSLRAKEISLKEQLNTAELAKWLSHCKLQTAEHDLNKYKSMIRIPDATKCRIKLPKEKLEKHKPSHLQVCLFDEDGHPFDGVYNIESKITRPYEGSNIIAATFSEFKKVSLGLYELSFTPTRAGDCEIQVIVNGTLLFTEPVRAMVYNYVTEPDFHKCYATGCGLKEAEMDSEIECQVVLLDSDSDPCWIEDAQHMDHDDNEDQLETTDTTMEDTKSYQITADLVHCKSKEHVKCDLTLQLNSQYKVTYKPTKRGKHQLTIKINGNEISGSPFTIAVTSSLQSLCEPGTIIKGLKKPYGATTNSQFNEIIVTEHGSHSVLVLSSEGKNIPNRSFGKFGVEYGEFHYPNGVTLDDLGNIYVADSNNHRIQKFTCVGKFLKSVGIRGSGQLQFYCPMGISFNPHNEKLYVCDQLNHRVQVINTDLTFYSTIGKEGTGEGEFQNTMDVAFNSNGDIYITDFKNHRVQIFNQDGIFLRAITQKSRGQKLQHPGGIAVDSNDTVYVSELDRGCIIVFTAKGDYLTTFGCSENVLNGEFRWPHGLHIDKNDSLLVCDKDNNQIKIF